MRAMMKKRGISAAFVAVVLVTAALITGCPNPESSSGKKDDYQPPEGMGAVKITFADTVEQRATILPGTTYSPSSFAGGFEFKFTTVVNNPGEDKTVEVPANGYSNLVIPLVAGTYSVEVTAYLTTYHVDPVANYKQSTLTIAAGKSPVSITVTLQAIADGTGTGRFSWSITNSITPNTPLNITQADMYIYLITGSPGTPEDLRSDFTTDSLSVVTGYKDLATGYYYVDFELKVDGKESKFRHILHIYKNMTSTFNYEFTNNHFNLGISKVGGITFTSFSSFAPTLTQTTSSLASTSGTGALTSPFKMSTDDNHYPDTLTLTVGNVGAFTNIEGNVEGTPVAGTAGVFTVTTTGGVTPFTIRPNPYQFTVTGKDTTGRSYSAEFFILVTDN